MSDAAAAMGAPLMIQHKGKEYALSPLDVDMIAMFERWLEDRAFAVVEGRKDNFSTEGYERALSAVVEQCAAGRYKYGGRAAEEATRTVEGQRFLTFLMLAKKSKGMSPKLAGEIYDAMAEELRAKMEVVNADPFDAPATPPDLATTPPTP